MWRLLSNNVVLVSQQVDAVRATWRVFRLISISLLATGRDRLPGKEIHPLRFRDIG